MVSNGLKFCR